MPTSGQPRSASVKNSFLRTSAPGALSIIYVTESPSRSARASAYTTPGMLRRTGRTLSVCPHTLTVKRRLFSMMRPRFPVFSSATMRPFIDDDDPVAHRLHLLQDMGGEDNRVVASQSADEVPDFDDLFGVQSDGRLVENDDRRISHQRAGDAHALTVALGQVAYDAPADIADMHDLAYLGKVRLAGQSASLDVVIEAEVLVHGHVEIQGRLFRQVSDQSFGAQRVSQHVNSLHDDASGRAGQASCRIFMVVDLPAPLGPSSPTTSPVPISSDTSSTAHRVP